LNKLGEREIRIFCDTSTACKQYKRLVLGASNMSLWQRLRSDWHAQLSAVTAVAHLGQAVAAAALIPQCSGSVQHLYRTSYIFITRTNFTSVREDMGEVNPAGMVCAFWTLSFMFQVLQLWQLLKSADNEKEKYENMVTWRYVEYAFSASVMFSAMGLLIGFHDLATFCMFYICMFATNVLGLAAHQGLRSGANMFAWAMHLSGWVTFGVPFALMCECMNRTNELSGLDVRIILSIVLVGACMGVFGFVQLAQLVGTVTEDRSNWIVAYCKKMDDKTAGVWYDALSLVAKSLLGWFLMAMMLDGTM
jgi:hypothetical protein